MITCPACSHEFNERAKLKRSSPAHRRYFGMIKLAFENWPSDYQFQPIDSAALRTFLQMRAGWVDTLVSSIGSIYMIPRSVAFDKMDQRQFGELTDRVSRIIGEVIGVTGDDLIEQSERAA